MGQTSTDPRRRFGDAGEQLVVEHLQREGYDILERNAACRQGELDIVAERDGVLCFVEVRRRATGTWGDPAATVSFAKQRKVVRAAMVFLERRRLFEREMRFDVASVVGRGPDAHLEYIPAAFDAGC